MKTAMLWFGLLCALGLFRPVYGLTIITDSVTIDRPFFVDPAEGVRVADGDTRTVVNVVDGGVVETQVDAHDSSVVHVHGGRVNALGAFDASTINVTGGDIAASIVAHNSSVVNVSGGSIGVGRPEDQGYAMYGGKRIPTVLSAAHDSTVNIFGGVLGHGFSTEGTINLYGASFQTGFLVWPEGTINVFGRDLTLTPIETVDTYTENLLTGTLLDGTPLDHLAVAVTSPDGVSGQIILRNVPEPTSWVLAMMGCLLALVHFVRVADSA